MSQSERNVHGDLDALIASIPPEWTAFKIRSARGRTRFICELARIDPEADGEDERYVIGRGSTVAEAVSDAIARSA